MQKAFSFDWISIKKIFIGALIAASAAAGIGFFQFLGAVQFTNPTIWGFEVPLVQLVAWGAPTIVNIIREFMKGEKAVTTT